MKEKVLITGGVGFIGSKLKSVLMQEGYEILTVGRNANEDFILNLSDDLKLNDVLKNFLPDVVCHLASGSNIERAEKEKDKEYNDAVLASKTLINCLEDIKQKQIKFIYLSSQSVYGVPKFLPVNEAHQTNPGTIYGEYKLKVEDLIRKSRLHYTIFRVSSVYGVGQDFKKSGVIAKFINKLMSKQSPVVFNSFDLFSDFIYVDDLTRVLVYVVKNKTTKNTTNEIFNLGSGVPITLKEILNILYKYFPDSPEPELKINPLYLDEEQKGMYLDITKVKSHLEWKPRYSICDGIEEILSSMKQEEKAFT